MQIQENISLKGYNTFGIDVKARLFSSFHNLDELEELTDYTAKSKHANGLLILGGGSNILFTKDYDGTVLKNEISGIEELHEDDEYVFVKCGAGENWHRFVQYCISRNWAGVENLSLIPGNTGASPMQNIGAYGVELKDVFWSLEAFHLGDKTVKTFTLSDCEFGYRESVFKKKFRDQFVILSVIFRLHKHPIFHTSYGAVEQELEKMKVKELSIRAISDAVIAIRSSKLPDPKLIGNAGSFFKNPEILNTKFELLKKDFPAIVGYPLLSGNVKLAAGWLIEQCGWKGFRKGDAGCHDKQALVLVNYGRAAGSEVFDISQKIAASVYTKFGVQLETEVNIF